MTIGLMAAALGMDAFSLTLGMGMLGLKAGQVIRIGAAIGGFHVAMPLAGIFIGKWVTSRFDMIALYVGGGLLVVMGLQMILASFSKSGVNQLHPFGFGLFLLALGVSIDSFSIGLSLGILGAKTLVTVALIGFMSMILSWGGLMLGNRFHRYIGVYSERLGGCILLGFGLQMMLPL
ncbi:manganese efflux pump MntP family protein [Bacillus sp. FSL W7-1360]